MQNFILKLEFKWTFSPASRPPQIHCYPRFRVVSFEQQYKVWTAGCDVTETFPETFPETQCLHWPNKP